MKCPYCGAEESKVIDSRPTEDSERIRRRRECLSCHMRFTTYEVVETVPLVVIKKDSSREPFDRQKLLNAMVRACAKRPVSYESLERAVSSIEQTLLSSYDREIPSVRIGELTMQELKKIDEVAYVRFASVYRQFADVESFFNELKKLMGDRKEPQKYVASEHRLSPNGAGPVFLFIPAGARAIPVFPPVPVRGAAHQRLPLGHPFPGVRPPPAAQLPAR